MSQPVVYKVSAFDKVTERLIKSVRVDDPDLKSLWVLFGSPSDDSALCLGEYPFNEEAEAHRKCLQKMLGHEPNFQKHEYFFGAFALPD